MLAQKKGFDEIVYYYYDFDVTPIPTQSILQKWLREKHKIHIQIEVVGQFIEGDNKFYSQVILFGENKWISKFVSNKLKYSYEEALEKALFKALKLIEDV